MWIRPLCECEPIADLQQVRAGQGCPAESNTGTSADQGSAGRGRWDGCAAGRRRDRLTRCSPQSPQPSRRWGGEAGRDKRTAEESLVHGLYRMCQCEVRKRDKLSTD